MPCWGGTPLGGVLRFPIRENESKDGPLKRMLLEGAIGGLGPTPDAAAPRPLW